MKKWIVLLTALAMLLALAACGGGGNGTTQSTSPASNSSEGAGDSPDTDDVSGDGKLKVTFITTAGGLGDRSFNDSTWKGVQRAGEELGVETALIEPDTVADFGSSIVAAANSGSDIILGVGASWTDTFDEYCERYPDIRFGGLNASVSADNLMVAITSDHEGSFLAGALAAMMTETGTVGAIGGMDGDNINRFLVGYEEGAKYVDPDTNVLTSYVGAFDDPAKGKEFAQQLMNEGADIIYHVAGGTGEGLFEAARENENLYAIGVDSDQDYIAEGDILTSMMKNCDVVAYDIIKSVVDGEFQGGNVVYDLSNGGVGLSPMTYTKDLVGEENLARLEEIRQKIVSGEITVTDVFQQ